MHSFEAGYEPALVPASHAVDGIIPDTSGISSLLTPNSLRC